MLTPKGAANCVALSTSKLAEMVGVVVEGVAMVTVGAATGETSLPVASNDMVNSGLLAGLVGGKAGSHTFQLSRAWAAGGEVVEAARVKLTLKGMALPCESYTVRAVP